MKKHISRSFLILLTAGLMLVAGTTQTAKAQDVMVSYQTFYDNLSPYGQWIYDPQYGNVWVPNEDGDFRPYGSRGYWVMTEYGNTWVSDDPWGWAVYHYGRWTYNPYYGWVWIPGYEWAPAWVSWRYGGGYAGWAPLGPGVTVGVSYYAPDSWWVFVSPRYMYQPGCIRYWNGPSYNTTYIHQTTIINNYYVDNSTSVRYNYGPRAEVIQQVTGRPVQVHRVSQLNRPGAPSVGRGTVSIYRPSVNRGSINEARPQRVMQAPQSVGRGQQVQQMGTGRQPAFRQEVQRMQQDGGRGMQQPNRDNGRDDDRQPGRVDTRNNDTRGRGGDDIYDTRNNNRAQPGRFDNNNERQQPQPERVNPRESRNNTEQQPDPRTRMQPSRYDSRMDNRQQPQQPQPQQPQPQQPQPATRQPQQPQPATRQQPQPATRQQPQPATRQQQQPQSQPQQSQPRGRGGR